MPRPPHGFPFPGLGCARRAALLALALAALGGSPAGAQPPASWDGDRAVTLEDGSRLWFVELPGPPTSEGGDSGVIRNEQAAFRSAAIQAGLRYRERHAFSRLWNGLSLAVDPASVARLQQMAGNFALYPVVAATIPESEEVAEPALLTALSMTGADVAQRDLGLSGAGIKVGVIDTGLDYDHPDLGGDGVTRQNSTVFPTARVVGGYDFVGDSFKGTNKPTPDPYPDDCWGHGTHVAGILGANGAVRGVAPGVTFYAYRVFGCSGSTPADILIEAMEQALDDGVQIVNMSLGTPFEWPEYPSAKAASRLVTRGVVVCASIGNDGATGLYSCGAPGLGENVIGVGSFDNNFLNLPAFSVSPDGHRIGYLVALGDPPPPPPPISGTFPLMSTSATFVTNDACDPLPPHSLAGKVALIRLGTCGAYTQARNAQEAGAAAVVIDNSNGSSFAPDVHGNSPLAIPVVGITGSDGALLRARLAAGEVDLTWGAVVSTPVATGGQTSAFSSFGLSPDLTLKPDLGAPGGFLRSTYPLEQGGYANLSGTSMASPHVAGAVALLLEAHPGLPARDVRRVLMNHADPVLSGTYPSALESVHHQGAGMLNIPASVLSTTTVEPEKLSLGESAAGLATRLLTIHNGGDADRVYRLSARPALGTGPSTFNQTYLPTTPVVHFDRDAVSVPAHGAATVSVTIQPSPDEPPGTIYGGYLVAAPPEGPETRVPFAGFCGDYQSLSSLTIGGIFDLPWLAQKVGRIYTRRTERATFTMQGEDIPYFIFHLDHQASIFRMEVFEAVSGRSWHRADDRKNVPRSALSEAASVMSWNGLTSFGNRVKEVPNGDYVMRISTLHALGDANDPAQWDVWTSPVITLARPDEEEKGRRLAAVAEPGGRGWELASPWPNPSSGEVSFRFVTPEAGPASLELFDVSGRRLRSWRWPSLAAGEHVIRWNGADDRGLPAPAGAVLCRLAAGGRTLTRLAVRLR